MCIGCTSDLAEHAWCSQWLIYLVLHLFEWKPGSNRGWGLNRSHAGSNIYQIHAGYYLWYIEKIFSILWRDFIGCECHAGASIWTNIRYFLCCCGWSLYYIRQFCQWTYPKQMLVSWTRPLPALHFIITGEKGSGTVHTTTMLQYSVWWIHI